jgi:hypothetical protein
VHNFKGFFCTLCVCAWKRDGGSVSISEFPLKKFKGPRELELSSCGFGNSLKEELCYDFSPFP